MIASRHDQSAEEGIDTGRIDVHISKRETDGQQWERDEEEEGWNPQLRRTVRNASTISRNAKNRMRSIM